MDPIRSLQVKTSSCRRLLKELQSYEKEVTKEAEKTDKMIASGADPYDIKQQQNVLGESRMMIPDSRKRIEATAADLQTLLDELVGTLQDSQEFKAAQEVLHQVQYVLTDG